MTPSNDFLAIKGQRRSTLHGVPKAGQQVAAKIRRQIITGVLREGETLPPEPELMEQFGVSRPTLREGFRVLESEGVIQVRRGAGGGARVLLPTVGAAARAAGTLLQYRGATPADVFEARTDLELVAVTRLARRRSARDLRALDQLIRDTDGAPAEESDEARRDRDAAFHCALVEVAGNQTELVMLEMMFTILDTHGRSGAQEPVIRCDVTATDIHATHTELVDLVRRQDTDAAVALWRAHLAETRNCFPDTVSDAPLEVLS